MDPCSYSDARIFRTTNFEFDWEVCFRKKNISGTTRLDCRIESENVDTLIFDSKDLNLENVWIDQIMCKFSIGTMSKSNDLGEPLIVHIPKKVSKGQNLKVVFSYSTSAKCSALQWLSPAQTCGGIHPYLFSQCWSIHARSLFPCQDSPGIKATYKARISVSSPLTALMSANLIYDHTLGKDRKVFYFDQHVPIPPYLVAIGVGELENRKIGPRSRVWCEKKMVEAAYEFSETEQFIKTGEELLGPYVWGNYDLLVLPPSFPYGGMENPCLTFVTPTLLAGDRSLVNVVAHEIAHSWTGNLVTNSSWEHFWLNEGFTMFIERKIIGRYYGKEHEDFHAIGGWTKLSEECKRLGEDNEISKLHLDDLEGSNPDDVCYTSIAYEKGFAFLWYLQTQIGVSDFEKFLKSYIQKFSSSSLTTQEFVEFFYTYFPEKKMILDAIDWKTWLKGTGMPPVKNVYSNEMRKKCSEIFEKWVSKDFEVCDKDLDDLNAHQICELLDQLQDLLLTESQIQKIERIAKISKSKNFEIRFRWIRLGLKAKYEKIIPDALDFVTVQGKLKLTRPIYRDLSQWTEMRDRAIDRFLENENQMHGTTAMLVRQDLKI